MTAHKFAQSVHFFFNDTASTEIYTLSLHDALPISNGRGLCRQGGMVPRHGVRLPSGRQQLLRHRGLQKIRRAHVLTPVTLESRMPASPSKNKQQPTNHHCTRRPPHPLDTIAVSPPP